MQHVFAMYETTFHEGPGLVTRTIRGGPQEAVIEHRTLVTLGSSIRFSLATGRQAAKRPGYIWNPREPRLLWVADAEWRLIYVREGERMRRFA